MNHKIHPAPLELLPYMMHVPRALPWAITLWTFGPESQITPTAHNVNTLRFAPTGRNVKAWGNAPGNAASGISKVSARGY